jgi:hypothetical protein
MSKRLVVPDVSLARDELIAFLRYAPSAREAVINMGDPSSTGSPTLWQDAAADVLRGKLAGMMSSFSLNLLNHLQLGAIDSVAVAEAAQAAEHDLPAVGSQPPVTVLSPGTTWTGAPVDVRAILASVALEFVGVPTLGVRNWDSLDFHSIDVASLREALLAAYVAGQQPAGPAGG